MSKKKKGHHTGRLDHKQAMHQGSMGMGTKDPHADPMHHEMNKKHGTPMGMSPEGDSDETGTGEGLTGGNCEDGCE